MVVLAIPVSLKVMWDSYGWDGLCKDVLVHRWKTLVGNLELAVLVFVVEISFSIIDYRYSTLELLNKVVFGQSHNSGTFQRNWSMLLMVACQLVVMRSPLYSTLFDYFPNVRPSEQRLGVFHV